LAVRGASPSSEDARPRLILRAPRRSVTALLIDSLAVLAAVFGWRAVRHLARALSDPGHADSGLRLVRGIRALIVAAASAAFALGLLYESRTLLLIAAVILGEELYETGVVLLVLRRQRRRGD
jgi:hypothetical protein